MLKYAQGTGKIAKNAAGETKRTEDLPASTEQVRRYLTRAELLWRWPPFSATADCASVKPALRRTHVGDGELTIRSSATYLTGGWDCRGDDEDEAGGPHALSLSRYRSDCGMS